MLIRESTASDDQSDRMENAGRAGDDFWPNMPLTRCENMTTILACSSVWCIEGVATFSGEVRYGDPGVGLTRVGEKHSQ